MAIARNDPQQGPVCKQCGNLLSLHSERTIYANEPREPMTLREYTGKGALCMQATVEKWKEKPGF